jgi:hypothetical protein
MTRKETLYIQSQSFIDVLRKEASEAKACVTQYSFQSLAISGAALGFIINARDREISSLATIPLILILMIMSRIAIYKYEIANRAYGYEFYLQTILGLKSSKFSQKDNSEEDIASWKFTISNEHWERTDFAWCIVYPTMLQTYYHVHKTSDWSENIKLDKIFKLRDEFSKDNNHCPWFLNSREEKPNTSQSFYSTGSYLSTIIMVLTTMQYLLLIILLIYNIIHLPYQLYLIYHNIFFHDSDNLLIQLLIIVMSKLFIAFTVPYITIVRAIRIKRREKILEDGLNTIKASALIWSVTVRLHYIAWELAKESLSKDSTVFDFEKEYKNNLFFGADQIVEYGNEPQKWEFRMYIEKKKQALALQSQ